jgi:hypothetical protein
MFESQRTQYSGAVQRYVVRQISALTDPALPEDEADNADLRSYALSEISDWSPEISRRPSSFLPRQSFLTSLGIRQLYSGLRQDELAEWVECLLTNSRLLHSVTVAFSTALGMPERFRK